MKKLLLIIGILSLLVAVAYPKDKEILITWTQGSANDIAGWLILWGEKNGGPYPNSDWAPYPGNQASYSYTVKIRKAKTTTYYYVIQAQDISGNLSPYSNQVAVGVDISGGPPDDTTPPPAPAISATTVVK